MAINQAVISDRASKRIRDGHFWIHQSDIVDIKFNGQQPVFVYNKKGDLLGSALYSPLSKIALRIFSRDEVPDIKRYVRSTLINSIKYRENLSFSGDCLRLVHSEADGLPGLVVDKYNDTLVFQTFTQPMEDLKEFITKTLSELMTVRQIFEKNDSKVREVENLPQICKTVYGDERDWTICCENHRFFYVDFYRSQKTSEFLDQKINRKTLSELANGSVLDLFCYHSWFGCNIDNADEIIAVDSSRQALDISKINFYFNNIYRFRLLEENVFDLLKRYDDSKRLFDTIILDPPAFIKKRRYFEQGYKGYKEINLRAMKILKRDGILATFSCSYHMTDTEFMRMLQEAASDTKTEFEIIHYLRQSPDHRELLGFPESHYLKGYILRKL